jgi:two-component system C4-dicarboxylate transport sensor histidine kinase DctB
MSEQANDTQDVTLRTSLLVRLFVLLFVIFAIAFILISNLYLTTRFSQSTVSRAELRLALYSSSIVNELQRNSVVPLLLSRDPFLISSLNTRDYSVATQRLISFRDEIRAANLMLLDKDGRTVAATDRTQIGTHHNEMQYFVNSQRAEGTIFSTSVLENGATRFNYSQKLQSDNKTIGVIVVEVDLNRLEDGWLGAREAVLVTDSSGKIILSSEPSWRNLTIEEALSVQSAPSAIFQAIRAAGDWGGLPPDAYLNNDALLRLEGKVSFQGWRLTYFTTYAPVRERVNGIIALEIMALAILIALIFYILSRRARYQSVLFMRESAELRKLNTRLQKEISVRELAERNLKVAEQSLAQSSKLAALGEMSAAVSHELNQPLAAMRTYLAGAKLLLQRARPDEALSSFQRIDDLIERMGAITKQLKSYARKGGDDLVPVDLRDAIGYARSIMAPQMNTQKVSYSQSLPDEPVIVLGDQVRLEQVIVNLIRNGLDATKGQDTQELEIFLSGGETATLSVQDNGMGIENLENLFEPFYTTKKPGDGVGLGLAISSGIVTDLGGRLTARNSEDGGAVFEMKLPLYTTQNEAAE